MHYLPFRIPIQCNNNMPKCYFSQVPRQLSWDRSGSAHLEMSPALCKAKELGFSMSEQHLSPKSLSRHLQLCQRCQKGTWYLRISV